jgi:hypothetical protein
VEPSPSDESRVDAGSRAMDCFCRERLCATASTRAATLATRRLRRAGMARPCVRKHGCGLGTTPRATNLAVGQSSCASGRPRRAGAPGQFMPLSSLSPRGEFLVCVPGFDPCWNVAGSPWGAAPRRAGRTGHDADEAECRHRGSVPTYHRTGGGRRRKGGGVHQTPELPKGRT